MTSRTAGDRESLGWFCNQSQAVMRPHPAPDHGTCRGSRAGREGEEGKKSSHCSPGCPLPRSTVLQQQYNRVGKVEHGSVALPAIMRSGASGPENFQVGSMPPAQQQITSGQMHRGHMPPLVRMPLLAPQYQAFPLSWA